MSELRSPLHAQHEALGAAMTPFAGWSMPLRYTSDLAEHHAVRTAAGLFDLSHMGELSVAGPDAAAFLDHALVGTASAIPLLRARYTMIVAEDGCVIDDLVVYHSAPYHDAVHHDAEDEYLVVANAANRPQVLAELRTRAAGFQVTITDRTMDTALIAVQGPAALAVVQATEALTKHPEPSLGRAPEALRYYACMGMSFAGGAVLVARTGYTGEDGFELFVDAADAPALWLALLAAGQPLGLVPAGLAARDSLRLEAGMPLYGNELDRTTTPYDAGLGRVVHLDKPGDFVGKDALAAAAQGQPRRVLVGLRGLTRRAARHGFAVVDPASATVVGQVTSGAPSPTLGYPVAMAYLDPGFHEVGTELAVDVRGRAEAVRVVDLPFYRRPSAG